MSAELVRRPTQWESSPCHFYPWVGPAYEAGAIDGLRALVLGESHYAYAGLTEANERTLTCRVIEEELEGIRKHRFISAVTTVLFGHAAVRDRKQFRQGWNQLAYYNFVQELAGSGSNHRRPSEDAWDRSIAPFRWLLSQLQPDIVLACGRTLYERLKLVDGLTSEPLYGDDAKRSRSRLLDVANGHPAVLGMIYHPASRHFTASEWKAFVQIYLDRARSVRARYEPA
ncbi:MAG TPA: hypothetical protein VFW04_10165 [Gemmatimonadaceae bacterium]|nr:hypothetical protein [Gemmatimonadaceae bacterium]